MFEPAVDSATNGMLNTGIWSQASDINFSQTLSNGNYSVYLWAVENYSSNFRSYNVKLEGAQVASAIGGLANNTWRRYGPYSVTVSDGTLNVNLERVTGDPVIQGFEIWSAVPPESGSPKILWQNKASGERSIWLMNGTNYSRSVSLGVTATSWNIMGWGDFNGDGNPDILWQHTSGAHSIWLMNGTVYVGSVTLESTATSWNIAGSGDFNGDGKADILWQNTTTGARSIWLMDGTTHTGSVSFGTVDKKWVIVGSDDFNGDGKTDILWQHTVSGARSIWLMNDTAYAGSVSLGTVAKQWNIVGSGDFNGDGNPDILWQHTSGARSIWLMNGTAYANSVSLGNVATSWDIRNY